MRLHECTSCLCNTGRRRCIRPSMPLRQPFIPFLSSSRKKGERMWGEGRETRGERTVDTTSTTETLASMHNHRAATERGARAAHVLAHRARAWCDVPNPACGMPVRRIVLCCEARLEYEDPQVWVRHRKTARDNAASGATYRTSALSEKGGRGRTREDEGGRGRTREDEGGRGRTREDEGGRGRTREDDSAPPAIIISYSSLMVGRVNIVPFLCNLRLLEKC